MPLEESSIGRGKNKQRVVATKPPDTSSVIKNLNSSWQVNEKNHYQKKKRRGIEPISGGEILKLNFGKRKRAQSGERSQ